MQRIRTLHGGRKALKEATSREEKTEWTKLADQIDERMGFERYDGGKSRVGWLCNMHSTAIESEKGERAAVDFYFIQDDGHTFKATVQYDPYFLVAMKDGKEAEVEEWCRRQFDVIKQLKHIEKEDLDLPNHLLGKRRPLLKLSFNNVNDLMTVRKTILQLVEKGGDQDIVDIREYDVPYHVRVSIDQDIRIGRWYTVTANFGVTTLQLMDRLQRADPVVMAFDIETTKLPLKFPDATIDQIMMISYMIDGQGFLITNREIVSEDIADFDYTPKPEFPGSFAVFNEPDERGLIERFFEHIEEARPTVIATYNGDFFDWPFVEARASVLGIDMYHRIGFRKNGDIYSSTYCSHMDAFAWVNRDSYLPQGSRGLKAVTVAKLGYDPDELDPELMTPYASERPQVLAEYSVSDAVATYYLYMKYVHPFIFSLCTIIPLGPDDTLRKGTGTLCEMLLMVQAYQKNIVLPNKHKPGLEQFWNGHLLESETYVGGHVESIEAGVFKSDIPCSFSIDVSAIDELLHDLDAALKFCITVEEKKSLDDVADYDEVKAQIQQKLESMRTPKREENPLIYHLDVASMYPNIMTTNRLQPDSMVNESDCAACDFNRPGKTCDRRLPWSWRGEYLPAKRDEYKMIRHALENEKFGKKTFQDHTPEERAAMTKKRLQDYCKKVYHKIHDATTIEREAIICQRENPFYVDTVKDFRDRRYDFKGQQKVWKGKADALKATGTLAEIEEAKKMIVLFDSLQLAHKVILNSFYGYVMRKGSRWFSMEMAGVTCLTGAHIIQMARQLVERIGRPLELDTDGIWCILPASFPENFTFTLKSGRKIFISYPCVMLNHLVHAKFTNHQYQTLDPATGDYKTHSDNTIFFEVDGPYRAMILPTSKEEDKNLKKRYAVFNHDGTLAELKGFEVKRRGELKLIKIFQTQIFKFFLEGKTLQETYESVASVANRWLDVLHEKGTGLADEELIDLICENKSMAKTLEEYGSQKSTAITTAKRLAEFLGEQMVKDKGLNCKYIIASRPKNAPVTERAIPVAIFSSEESIKRHFLRKWMKSDPGDMDPRSVLDWGYYLERLGSVVQKLITIPAALQKVRNPVPRVAHPDWLERRIRIKDDVLKQRKVSEMLGPAIKTKDLEDFGRLLPETQVVVHASAAPAPAPAAVVIPDPNDDYLAFLRFERQRWKSQKQARIRRRQLFGDRRDGFAGIFKSQAELYATTWQILQLRPGRDGEVKAFVLIANQIHTIRIVVPRQIVLDMAHVPDVDIAGCSVTKINHSLPNGQTSPNLYRLELSEQTYLKERPAFTALLDGGATVYEGQVDATLRATLAIGNACTFDETPGVLGRGLDNGFDLSTLRHVPCKYLEGANVNYIYIQHIVSGDRQAFAVFSRSRAHLILFSQDVVNAERIYTEMYNERIMDQGEAWRRTLDYSELQMTISTSTRRAAFAELAELIDAGPCVVVLRSPSRSLIDEPFLQNRPVLLQPIESPDLLPSLSWQTILVRMVVHNWFDLGLWLANAIDLARYGNIPVCNLQHPSYLIDIAFARKLQQEQMLLWWSDGSVPDYHEQEVVLEPPGTTKNSSGTFSTICIDVDIKNLHVNTILTASLNDEDMEPMQNIPGLNVLRAMVKSWHDDACSGNPMADVMVQHLVRWSSSPHSRMYNPTLHRHIALMAQNSLESLSQECQKVGASVVYASQNRVLLHTTKTDVGNAFSYTQYIIKAIKAKAPYIFLDLDVREFWDYLVWHDVFNYGGKSCSEAVAGSTEVHFNNVMHWQFQNYLPAPLQPHFHEFVNEFVELVHRRKRDASITVQAFSQKLKTRIVELIRRQRQELLHAELALDYARPVLPGSAMTDGDWNPVLSLVKTLTYIFSLEKPLELELRLLRKELLALFEVREFSATARFKDPSTSLPVKVICESCGTVQDLDLCRDDDGLNLTSYTGGAEPLFKCALCLSTQPPLPIQERLVADVEKMNLSWTMQDLACGKCRRPMINEFMDHCACAGDWVGRANEEENDKKLSIYKHVAGCYDFGLVSASIAV